MEFLTAFFIHFLILGGVFQFQATGLPTRNDGSLVPSPRLSATAATAKSRSAAIADGWGFESSGDSSRRKHRRPFSLQPSPSSTETAEASRRQEDGKNPIPSNAIPEPMAFYEYLRFPSEKPKVQSSGSKENAKEREDIEEDGSSADYVARKGPKVSQLRIILLPRRPSGLFRAKRGVSSPKPPASSKYADEEVISLPLRLRRRRFHKIHEERSRHDLVSSWYPGSSDIAYGSLAEEARAQRLKIVISGFQF